MHAKKDSKHKEMLWEMPFFHGTLNKEYINMKYEHYSSGGIFPILYKLLTW